jgi:hypothetical protein
VPTEHRCKHGQDLYRPAVNRRVVDAHAPFRHHLLDVTKAQRVCGIPAHAYEHDLQRVVNSPDHLAQRIDHRHHRLSVPPAAYCDRTTSLAPDQVVVGRYGHPGQTLKLRHREFAEVDRVVTLVFGFRKVPMTPLHIDEAELGTTNVGCDPKGVHRLPRAGPSRAEKLADAYARRQDQPHTGDEPRLQTGSRKRSYQFPQLFEAQHAVSLDGRATDVALGNRIEGISLNDVATDMRAKRNICLRSDEAP